jgi:hypothetical protein
VLLAGFAGIRVIVRTMAVFEVDDMCVIGTRTFVDFRRWLTIPYACQNLSQVEDEIVRVHVSGTIEPLPGLAAPGVELNHEQPCRRVRMGAFVDCGNGQERVAHAAVKVCTEATHAVDGEVFELAILDLFAECVCPSEI